MIKSINKANSMGFCTGVRHAIEVVTNTATKLGKVETLGALVHNKQVIQRLSRLGVNTIDDISLIKGDTVVISAHGVSPVASEQIRLRGLKTVDTTCAFVNRAQKAAKNLMESGFFVVVFGDVDHPEVKGILGWADGQGMATLDARGLQKLSNIPRRLGLLSQTTQIPADFIHFAKDVIDLAFIKDAEIRLIDTICYETRRRQADTLELAHNSDLVFVIGGRNSANTKRLHEICSAVTATRWIETAYEIEPVWLEGKERIGITAGASTDDDTINEVLRRLNDINHSSADVI